MDALRLSPNRVGHLDRIGAGLLVDHHIDGRASVDGHVVANVLVRIFDGGDVAQIDRHAVAGGDADLENVVDIGEFAAGAQQDLVAALAYGADRSIQVFVADRADDFGDREVESAQFLEVEVDVNLPP